MRTINNPNQHLLCFTSKQIDAAKALNAALDQPEIQLIEPIHSLAYALILACPPEVEENQFLSPDILYLVYSGI